MSEERQALLDTVKRMKAVLEAAKKLKKTGTESEEATEETQKG